MAVTPPTSPEETLQLIAARANLLKEQGQPPVFELNLSRRSTGGVPNQLASFIGVTLEHIANPVRWLPQLCGGGEYIMNIRHPDLPDRIGGPLPANFDAKQPGMEPRAIDPRVTKLPTWQGPTLAGGAYQEPLPNVPPTGHAGATALPWGQSQLTTGYGLPQPAPTPQVDRERELAAQLADMKAALARTEAESRARADLENERRASAERERQAEQRARDAQALMQQQLATLQAQVAAAQAAPKPDPASGWKEMLAIAMPLVQQMLTSQHEMRVMMMKMSEEQNRRQIEASEKQHAAQMEMIRAITAKPPGMSEELRLLIETLKADKGNNSAEAMATFMTKQIEAMGVMSRMSMELVNAAADIQLGDSEHPIVGAIREASSAVKVMMDGASSSAKKMVPQKKLAPGQQQLTPQQVAQLQAQQRAAQQQAQARATAAAQVGKQPPPAGPRVVNVGQQPPPKQPQQPAQVITFTPPAQAPQPAPQPEVMQGPDGATYSHFEVLKAGIAELKPAEEVVNYLASLKNADEPSFKAALAAHDDSPWELLKAEFGMKFISSNMGYFQELGELIDARGVQDGWWPADDEEGGEQEEGGEEESQTLTATIPLDVSVGAPVPENAALAEPAKS